MGAAMARLRPGCGAARAHAGVLLLSRQPACTKRGAADPGPPEAPSCLAAELCAIPDLQRSMSSKGEKRWQRIRRALLLMLHGPRDTPLSCRVWSHARHRDRVDSIHCRSRAQLSHFLIARLHTRALDVPEVAPP